MNVLLINGSPHKTGCTYTALTEVSKALQADGIETEIFHIGAAPVGGCVGCGGCAKAGQCVFGGPVADVLPLVQKADGLVFGAPVHYATAAGSMLGFLHRLAMSGGQYLRHKPAAVVTSARRAGSVCSMDVVNKHFSICSMPIVSSTYWNHVFGNTPAEVEQDAEGLMTMRNIGKNMAWLLKCIEQGKAAGVEHPENVKVTTNFVK